MSDTTDHHQRPNFGWLRPVAWGGALALILLPLAVMLLAPDAGVDWTIGDFLFAILMVGGVGLALEAAVRISADWSYRAGAALGLATGFLLVWSNAAVGYIGDDNPYNIVFFGVVGIAFVGALLAAFAAKGMAITMLIAGIAHAIAGGIGFPEDPVTGPITLVFTGMWLAAAKLFHKAARQRSAEDAR